MIKIKKNKINMINTNIKMIQDGCTLSGGAWIVSLLLAVASVLETRLCSLWSQGRNTRSSPEPRLFACEAAACDPLLLALTIGLC